MLHCRSRQRGHIRTPLSRKTRCGWAGAPGCARPSEGTCGQRRSASRGRVGFAFTKEDLTEIRDSLLASKVPTATCVGAIALCRVTVPAQDTSLGPEKTPFFQALGITAEISRGTVEILRDVQLIKTGDRVGASGATLLNTLNLSPSSFGLIIRQGSDCGSIDHPDVLDVTEETLDSPEGIRELASVCLQIGSPAVESVPHSIISGYKWVLPLSGDR
uniref:Large ribosomal subunit protein uL10-like insertion domain-containing protein n=1 Tax=Sus scrofa TaxID=9823 RepID=A0A8D1N933_PIG